MIYLFILISIIQDYCIGVILCFSLETVNTLAGSTTIGSSDGSGSNALFGGPSGVAVDPNSGCVYVSDKIKENIRKITSGGNFCNLLLYGIK